MLGTKYQDKHRQFFTFERRTKKIFANQGHLLLAMILFSAFSGCAERSSIDGAADVNQKNSELNAVAPSLAETAGAGQEVVSTCDVDKNCKVNLDHVPRAVEICDGLSPNLYWSLSKPAFLFSCECDCTSHENSGWLILSGRRAVRGVALGKPATVKLLRERETIQDIMASHPLCGNMSHELIDTSDFVSLIKYPTGDDDNPYCFEPRFFRLTEGALDVVENGSSFDAVDSEAFFETDIETESDILELVDQAQKLR